MKQKTNKLAQFKQWILSIVICCAWFKNTDNQILLFNVGIVSLPLLLLGKCTLQTGIITFSIWCVGIAISVIFWRIRLMDNRTPNLEKHDI